MSQRTFPGLWKRESRMKRWQVQILLVLACEETPAMLADSPRAFARFLTLRRRGLVVWYGDESATWAAFGLSEQGRAWVRDYLYPRIVKWGAKQKRTGPWLSNIVKAVEA